MHFGHSKLNQKKRFMKYLVVKIFVLTKQTARSSPKLCKLKTLWWKITSSKKLGFQEKSKNITHLVFSSSQVLQKNWLIRKLRTSRQAYLKESAYWTDAFYKLICPYVCVSVHFWCFSLRLTVFLTPTSRSPMSKLFRFSEALWEK